MAYRSVLLLEVPLYTGAFEDNVMPPGDEECEAAKNRSSGRDLDLARRVEPVD
jgi:hypothetical protein